ncbi:hypothetical protein K7432_012198 [Basidiobolus ranarum]|uniref:Uncharacterized protein n=1 Tax=Basidiobolus ranarum TaxID=34480 RepID=A0ABR2WLB9_9FUNG
MQLKQLSLVIVSAISAAHAASPNDVCQYVFAPASLTNTHLCSAMLDLNSTSGLEEEEAREDPTSLDDAYGKDFNQVITDEIGVNADCTTRICDQAGNPIRKNQKFRLRLEGKCNGSILNTDLYLKGPQTCSFFVNPHWHTDKKQNQSRFYWGLTQGNNPEIMTNTPTVMVSTLKKTCYDSAAKDPDTALADAIIALLNALKGGGVIYDKFFYAMSTSHGENGVDMHRQREGGKAKKIHFEYVMRRNNKYLYNLISSEHGRRKFLFRCSGDDTRWTNNFADDTYVEFRTD